MQFSPLGVKLLLLLLLLLLFFENQNFDIGKNKGNMPKMALLLPQIPSNVHSTSKYVELTFKG